jgi:hypothetical protein
MSLLNVNHLDRTNDEIIPTRHTLHNDVIRLDKYSKFSNLTVTRDFGLPGCSCPKSDIQFTARVSGCCQCRFTHNTGEVHCISLHIIHLCIIHYGIAAPSDSKPTLLDSTKLSDDEEHVPRRFPFPGIYQ